MSISIKNFNELKQTLDAYLNSPQQPPIDGISLNQILTAMVSLLRKQTKSYPDITARDLDPDHSEYAFVLNATADPDLPKGPAVAALYFFYQDKWNRVSIVNDLNLTLDWKNIKGKPDSDPLKIDETVKKSKFTSNFTVSLPNNTLGIANGTDIGTSDEVESIVRQMLRKAVAPVYLPPTISLGVSPQQSDFEVGTSIDLIIDPQYNQNDGGASSALSIKKKTGTENFIEVGTGDPYLEKITISQSPIIYKAVYTHGAGEVKNDSFANPHPSGKIPAGTLESQTVTFKGYRNLFVGFFGADNSEQIRALNAIPNPSEGANFNINVPKGASRVSIFYPADLRDLSRVLYLQDSNKNITGNFVKRAQTIQVEGANGYLAIPYKGFDFVPVDVFPTEVTYNITI